MIGKITKDLNFDCEKEGEMERGRSEDVWILLLKKIRIIQITPDKNYKNSILSNSIIKAIN